MLRHRILAQTRGELTAHQIIIIFNKLYSILNITRVIVLRDVIIYYTPTII